MSLVVEEAGSFEHLSQILRRSGTQGDPGLHPYGEAHISLEAIDIGDVIPLELPKYVLEEQLDYVKSLQQRLLAAGVDIHYFFFRGLDELGSSGVREVSVLHQPRGEMEC